MPLVAWSREAGFFMRRWWHGVTSAGRCHGDGQPRRRSPKSKASRRTVPLPDFLVDALAAHLAVYPAELDELVFRNERGGPLRRANFQQRVWLPSLERSGLAARPTLHDPQPLHPHAGGCAHPHPCRPESVQLAVADYTRACVRCLSRSYGVWPPRPPWGR